MDKLIYLASPYSDKDQSVIERRVRQAQHVTAKLIQQGHLVFSPIVSSHPIADLVSFEAVHSDSTDFSKAGTTWLDYDRAMIDKSDEVWVLCIDGWQQSRGIAAEVSHAFDTGKDVHFVEYPTLRISEAYSAFLNDPVEIALDDALVVYEDFAEAERRSLDRFVNLANRKPCTIFGAGSYYSPASSGRPPFFTEETHTTYAPTESERFYCHDCGDEITENGAHYCDHPDSAYIRRTIDEVARADFGYPDLRSTSLPDDAAERNSIPMADGLLYYFPNALAEVSKISKFGNDQHNPGQPMHWSRGKSTDHANKIIRHLVDAGKKDSQGNRHSAFAAWRALALLQEEIEAELNLPLPKNVWVD